MGFTNLWPLFLTFTIPLLVMLYILKRKYKEKKISSSLLWSEVYKNTHANTPFEKLRKNIMLFLQLLILSSIIFALMGPFLKFGGKEYKNVILVLDTTGSMNTKYEETTRLEKGKAIAKEYIDSIKEGVNTTLITYNGVSEVLLTENEDKKTTLKTIGDIKGSYSSGNIDEVVSLVRAIGEGFGIEYETVFITDKELKLGDINGKVISLANSGENAAIDNIAHKVVEDKLKVIATISNRGEEDYSGDFTLYDENGMLDVKSLDIKKGEKITLDYELENTERRYLKGELSKKDLLEEDNTFYDVIRAENTKRILLVTEQNVFLEKAFSSLDNVQLLKTNDFNNVTKEDKYDLYIFDNVTPEALPKEGNILFINPKSNELFKVLEGGELKQAEAVTGVLSRHLDNMKFTLSKYNSIELPYWGNGFLKVEDSVVGFIGEKDNIQIGALAFDIHDTDVALKQEFPIMIYELGERLISNGLIGKNNYKAGDEILAKISNMSTETKVYYPGNKTANLKYSDLINSRDTLGLYKITDTVNGEKRSEEFAVNFPSETESNIDKNSQGEFDKQGITKGIRKGFNLSPIILLLALLVVAIEWIYYLRGN